MFEFNVALYTTHVIVMVDQWYSALFEWEEKECLKEENDQ